MKNLFFISLILSAGVSFAAKAPVKSKPVYEIQMQTSIDGIKSSSTITVQEGASGSIEAVTANLGGRFQEVTLNKTQLEGKPALHMDFIVGEVDRFGTKTVIATPKIIATVGEKSTVMMGSTSVGKKLIFSALAKPIKSAKK